MIRGVHTQGPWASTRAALGAKLAAIRAAGHAELAHSDAHSFAVAVLGSDGQAVAAIGAAVPAYRLGAARRTQVLAALHTATQHLAHALELEPAEKDA